MTNITRVIGREILDSRGNPTVEAEVTLENGVVGRAAAPSGASTGEREAIELRDGDSKRYLGKGVTRAVGHINNELAALARGRDCNDQSGLDHMDRRLIVSLIEKFDGGPVGVESLAAAIGEERGTIEDVIEPYLIQQGFMMRTPRGRVVTSRAYSHFGLKPLSQGEIDL